ILITLWSGVKAVWNSFNRLFHAMSQVTGGVMVAPGTAALAAAGAGALATGAAAGVGSNALAGMTALHRGATLAQAAGVTFGGSPMLTGAARTLAYLPGARHTALGEAAEQFTEGSVTRQVARHIPVVGRIVGPLVGASLLSNRDPAQAEVNAQGQVVNRPMLVPAVGEGLDSWTIPRRARRRNANAGVEVFEDDDGTMLPGNLPDRVRPRRMGTFTPISTVSEPATISDAEARRQRERSDYKAEMVSEEMEQHISDALRAHTGPRAAWGSTPTTQDRSASGGDRLEQAADALLRAAQVQMQPMLGQLRVAGVPNVASVMGDVVGQIQAERRQTGQPSPSRLDHLQVADRMARAVGVTPQAAGGSPIQRDLARFGLFVDQALKLGLTPQQTERVVREVQSSPEGRMQPATRELLDQQAQTAQGVSWLRARDEVDRLEHSARMLPPEINAYGVMAVPMANAQPQVNVTVDPTVQVNVQAPATEGYDSAMRRASALGGSGAVVGGSL
ncbi:MAG: hypothetical protein SNJ54_15805, partial [Anaerolineae bacterium]